MGPIKSTNAEQNTNKQILISEQCNHSIRNADENRMLFSGYFRQIQQDINLSIPNDIQYFIMKDYCSQYIIYGAGANKHGLFGLGHTNSLSYFQKLPTMQQLVPHSKNIYHNSNGILIQNINHQIYVSGFNRYNALGIDSISEDITSFTKVELNDKISLPELISRGSHNIQHTFIYGQHSDKHKLLASGYNCGQFGNQKYDQLIMLLEIDISFILDKIIDIKCGLQHTLFLTEKGTVWSFGYNDYGQCAVFNSKPTELMFSYKIIKIECGTFYSALINEKHQLICFGANHFGQLGISNKRDAKCVYNATINEHFDKNNIELLDINCNETHSLCIDKNGNCYSFGNNDCGQIGNGIVGGARVFTPYKIVIPVYCGSNRKKIIDFSCGKCHNILLSNDHRIICFGDNEYNQCSSMYDGDIIPFPYILSKFNELGGIDELAFVQKVYAFNNNTIIIVNPLKIIH